MARQELRTREAWTAQQVEVAASPDTVSADRSGSASHPDLETALGTGKKPPRRSPTGDRTRGELAGEFAGKFVKKFGEGHPVDMLTVSQRREGSPAAVTQAKGRVDISAEGVRDEVDAPGQADKPDQADASDLDSNERDESFLFYGTAEPEPRPTAGPRRLALRPGSPVPPLTALRRFNTTRLLPAQYSESVLTRIADTDEDLQLIFALDNATNERLLAESNLRLGVSTRDLVFQVPYARIINAAFAHPHPQGARFSTPYRGAWYAGFELATARAEVLFHRTLQFAEIAWGQREELDYDQYLADFNGIFHDLRPEAFAKEDSPPEGDEPGTSSPETGATSPAGTATSDRPPAANQRSATRKTQVTPLSFHASGSQGLSPSMFADCLDPASYRASQNLAIQLLEAGSLGIVYPSTRRAGGSCIACFRPSLVNNVRKHHLYRLVWEPGRATTFLRVKRESEPMPHTSAVRGGTDPATGVPASEDMRSGSETRPEPGHAPGPGDRPGGDPER